MKKLIFAVIAGVAVMGAAQAQDSYPKTYVGVGVASVDHDFSAAGTTNGDSDGWNASGKVFAGYDFNPTWGVELGYTDFRKSDVSFNVNGAPGNGSTKGHAAYLAGKFSVPINEQFGAYAKLGASYNKASLSTNTPGYNYDDSRTTAYGALGLQYKLNEKVSLIGEYERYGDKRDFGPNPNVITIGARYSF